MKKYYGITFKIGLVFMALGVLILFLQDKALGESFECRPYSVQDNHGNWSKAKLKKFKPSTTLKNNNNKNGIPTIKRCSYSLIKGKHSCDTLTVGYLETSSFSGVKSPGIGWPKIDESGIINKYYFFKDHIDLQIIIVKGYPTATYIENNGRGTIHRGSCEIIYKDLSEKE